MLYKDKISYYLGFIAIGVAMGTERRHYVFIYLCVSLYQEFFLFVLRNRLKGVCTCHNCLNYGKV